MPPRKASESVLLARWFVKEILGETWSWQSHLRHIKMARQTLVGNSLQDVQEAIRLRQRTHKVLNIFEAKYTDRETGKTYLELVKFIPPPPAAGQYAAWTAWMEKYAAKAVLRGDKLEVPQDVAEYLRARNKYVQHATRPRSGASGIDTAWLERRRQSRTAAPVRRGTDVGWADGEDTA